MLAQFFEDNYLLDYDIPSLKMFSLGCELHAAVAHLYPCVPHIPRHCTHTLHVLVSACFFRPLLARSSCASLSMRALYHSTLHAFSTSSSPCVLCTTQHCTHFLYALAPACFFCSIPARILDLVHALRALRPSALHAISQYPNSCMPLLPSMCTHI